MRDDTTSKDNGLGRTAEFVANATGDMGALIITVGDGGTRVGVSGLSPQQMRDALCYAVLHSYVIEHGE